MIKNAIAYITRKRNRTLIIFIILTIVFSCLYSCLTIMKSSNEIEKASRISNNLNQYARKANETGKLYEEDIAEIKKMNNEQTELLKKVLEAVIHLYEDDSKKRK